MCFHLPHDEVRVVDELIISQEEADTRVLLHAKHASVNVASVIIVAEDTDIMILCLAFHDKIDCKIYVKCGTSHKQYISITHVARAIGDRVCRSLSGLHAFTGCDTVSPLVVVGSLQAFC